MNQLVENQEPLFDAQFFLLSKGEPSADGGIPNARFGGVASCESIDVEGEALLRKHLDITYLQQRGYVNWDHSRAITDQIGFITKALIIPAGGSGQYEDILKTSLSKSASLYVEGQLYAHSKHAQEVSNLLKSIPEGAPGALGMSVEGSKVVDKETGLLKKAIVRGVAITPAPIHPETCARILKSLGLDVNRSVERVELSKAIPSGLSFEQAVVRVMERNPKIRLPLAKQIVHFIIAKRS